MWRGNTVSVILPTYRERDSIRKAVQDLLALGVVDEIVVTDNNAEEGTREEVAKAGSQEKIKIVFEGRQGYGFSCRKGLEAASGDYLILMEPDGTFLAEDILKLLAFDEFDFVLGTRTCRRFIRPGTAMGFALRAGNWAMAKIVQLMFGAPSITDVGCTTRLIKRPLYEEIRDRFTVGGNYFSPEMMILVFLRKDRFRGIELPVNFLPRVGESQGTPTFKKQAIVAIQMFFLALRYRILGR